MRPTSRRVLLGICAAGVTLVSAQAGATTIAQNSAWNVTRPGATETLRIVAYGDSIYAGYINFTTVARRAGPHVAAEYGAALWGQNIEVRRRAQSGATASGIYSRITSATDRAFMQTANTRVVTFAMCGNDYLGARSSFAGQGGTCSYAGLENAYNTCRNFTEQAIQYIDANAHPNVKLKIAGNLYYPGFDSDNVQTNCTDPESGERFNRRDKFLPLLARSNWMTCNLAEQYGWECADNFAEYMAADYDSNGDGIVDSDAIRYRSGESLEDYVERITVTYVDTLSDSNFKEISDDATADYLQSDDTHATYTPTNLTGGTLFGTPGGNVALQFATAGAYPNSKNPVWNLNGSDRIGYELARPYDLNVDAGPDKSILACERYDSSASFKDRVFWGPWPYWVDYGNGAGTDAEIGSDDATTIPLGNVYSEAGTYTVDVLVKGAYNTLWSDTATVTVRTATDAVGDLLGDLDALYDSGAINRGMWNGPRQSLIMAHAKLSAGQLVPGQSMIKAFIRNVSAAAFDSASRERLVAYAERAHLAAACNPLPRGEPPFGRPKPDRKAAKPLLPDMPDQLWLEIDGVHYDEGDVRIIDVIRAKLGLE